MAGLNSCLRAIHSHLVNTQLEPEGMSSLTPSSADMSHKQTYADVRHLSAHISKKNPPASADRFLSFLIIFFLYQAIINQTFTSDPKMFTFEHFWKEKKTVQTIIRKSCADFGVCVCALPSLSHLASYMFPLRRGQRWVLQWQVIKPSLLSLELSHSQRPIQVKCFRGSVSRERSESLPAKFFIWLCYECLHEAAIQTAMSQYIGAACHLITASFFFLFSWHFKHYCHREINARWHIVKSEKVQGQQYTGWPSFIKIGCRNRCRFNLLCSLSLFLFLSMLCSPFPFHM